MILTTIIAINFSIPWLLITQFMASLNLGSTSWITQTAWITSPDLRGRSRNVDLTLQIVVRGIPGKNMFLCFFEKKSFKKYVENPMKTIDSQSSNPIPKAKHHFLYQKITQLQKPRHLFPIWAKLLHFLLRRLRHRRSATELGGQRLAIHPRRRLGGRGCGIGFDHSLIFFGGW